jgi:ubiquinone/menaquinone biosynthesis C-methylase UbiE
MANRRICDRLERLLPADFVRSFLYAHELYASAEISRRGGQTWVLDLGGGRNSPFVRHLSAEARSTVVAIDLLESELKANRQLDCRIVADVCRQLPLRDQSMDVVVTRSVLEHLVDPAVAVGEIGRVLADGGVCIHVFPARYSPFSALNTIVSQNTARRLLNAFFPEWRDSCGFPAFYRHCDAHAMAKLHRSIGFAIKKVECRYYQSIYYKFFVPLYLASLAYDLLMYWLKRPLLASQVLLIAEKQGNGDARSIAPQVSALPPLTRATAKPA